MNQKQIMIGGREVMVPDGYLQAEEEFTKDESAIFYALDDGLKKEAARAAVLEKRVEFYYLFLAGEADIQPIPEPKKSRTFLQKLRRWSIGYRWD